MPVCRCQQQLTNQNITSEHFLKGTVFSFLIIPEIEKVRVSRTRDTKQPAAHDPVNCFRRMTLPIYPPFLYV